MGGSGHELQPTEPLDADAASSGHAGRLQLLIWEPGGGARERDLERGIFSLGRRGADVDIEIDDPAVSRVHARLFVDDVLEVEDAGSSNGTYVARKRIEQGRHVTFSLEEPVVVGGTTIVVRRNRLPPPSAERRSPFVPPTVDSLLRQVAGTRWAILIVGETGTGKTRVAQTLHEAGGATGQRVDVHCRGATEAALEQELFGSPGKEGAWERARRGTVVVEDITEMPPAMQARLARALDRPEAGDDPRIVATSRVGPAEALRLGVLRKDLRYRLGAVTVVLPPLRERSDSLSAIADALLDDVLRERGSSPRPLTDEAHAFIADQAWPGNLRELESVLRSAVLSSTGPGLAAEALRSAAADAMPSTQSERERIVAALAECGGNQSAAARLLGISRGTLVSRIREYGLTRPRKR